jgi:hypothetical protein
MKTLLKIFALILFAATAASAQDPEVRREAVQMLERAHGVSLSPHLPDLERIDTFRVLDAGSGPREGTFTRVVVQGTGRRDEATFGDYHALDIWSAGHLATVRTNELPPAEVNTVLEMTPIHLIRFDGEDVIRRVVQKVAAGKNARCIEFDTITGQKVENNEVCVDPSNGTLLLVSVGDERVENSDFFPFAGALMPGKIVYSFGGIRKLEISQTMTELKDAGENVLAAPPDAQIRNLCRTFRRPIGVSMPQPKAGNGGRDIDVAVRGIIGMDGKIHEAVVQSAERADLASEALGMVQQWIFTPGMCDGNPNTNEATFIVHFHGR